jgi:hypothetical protein
MNHSSSIYHSSWELKKNSTKVPKNAIDLKDMYSENGRWAKIYFDLNDFISTYYIVFAHKLKTVYKLPDSSKETTVWGIGIVEIK